MTHVATLAAALLVVATFAVANVASGREARRTPHGADAPPTGMPTIDRAETKSEGQVTEALAAGSYRYLRVTDEAGVAQWVVTLPLAGRSFAVGDRVRVHGFGSRALFTSKKLDRTFDHLTFAVVTRAP